MELEMARNICRELMNRHGLEHWKLTLNSTPSKRFGRCIPRIKEIELSSRLVEMNTGEQVADTILHEIAHAIEHERHGYGGHSYYWKKICKEIGAEPTATYSEETVESPASAESNYKTSGYLNGQLVRKGETSIRIADKPGIKSTLRGHRARVEFLNPRAPKFKVHVVMESGPRAGKRYKMPEQDVEVVVK